MKPRSGLCLALIITKWALALAQCEIEAKAENVRSREFKLSWATNKDCFIQDYKINISHLKYKACPRLTIPNNVLNVSKVQNDDNTAFISGLEPNSIYKLSLQGLDNGDQTVTVTLEVETKSEVPQIRPEKGHVDAYTKALKFSWDPLHPKVNKTVCQNLKGQMKGYRVELIGLNKWSSGLIKTKENLSELQVEYYAQALKPYTRYKLRVYVTNENGLYNKDLALELYAQTMSYKPEAPINTQATPTTPEEIHLRWQPHFPPTGLITKYKVKYAPKPPKASVIDWKKEVEIANDSNICSKNTENLVCYRVRGLNANTTYVFQVQTFNANFSQPSDFSPNFEATTDPLNPITPMPIATTTSKQSSRLEIPENPNQISTQTALIIVSLIIIMVLICIVAFLVYKVKMHKLAMVYEARHRQLQNEILTSPQRSHSVLGGSVSFIGNGSYCYPGNESVANTTITTIHDWVSNQNHSINYQVEREKEIQRRKLPDPPTAFSKNETEDMYENASIGSPDLLREIQQEISNTVIVTNSTPRRISCEDVDGYLRPTFPERPPPATLNANSLENATVIPTESYVSSVSLQGNRTMDPQIARTISPTTSTESHPLISLKK